MKFTEQLYDLIPCSPSSDIQWDKIDPLFSGICFSAMKDTPQNPVYHGEGDVYTHTQMVCRELAADPDFYTLSDRHKEELFLAALLHDIGKVKTTRLENGVWTSPHHSLTGSQIVRTFLWRDCGLCGTMENIIFRETVCSLVLYHMLPVNLIDRNAPEKKARKTAAAAELAADFSWYRLCMLSKADVKGRISDDIEKCLEQIRLAELTAEDAECFHGPYPFKDSFTGHAYLSGRNVTADQTLFDDTWGEVIMISGLPGTGKDTWIRQYNSGMPVISLDDIRKEMHISHGDPQGAVIRTAQEQARIYLRKKQPFIWNATDLTKDLRQKLITFFEQYKARVRIIYLETDWNKRAERNMGRDNAVPESAVNKLLEKTVPPLPDEAQAVEWRCI